MIKRAVITHGSFSPPTLEFSNVIDTLHRSSYKADSFLFVEDERVLSYDKKVEWLAEMYPKVLVENCLKSNNILDSMRIISEQGKYDELTIVCESDRVKDLNSLALSYNGFLFEFESIRVVSCDPSNSKGHTLVEDGDVAGFIDLLPKGFGRGKELFNECREGMGLEPLWDGREHVTISECKKRDMYVRGEIFQEGSTAINTKTKERIDIVECKSNFVVTSSGEKLFISNLSL